MNLSAKVGKGINENFRKITSETDKRPRRMQTLMRHYFGGEDVAFQHRAAGPLNFPAALNKNVKCLYSTVRQLWEYNS